MALSAEAALRKDRSSYGKLEHRHLATVAKIINNFRRPSDGPGSESYFQADTWARHFARELAGNNPNFDRQRFLTAAGVTEDQLERRE